VYDDQNGDWNLEHAWNSRLVVALPPIAGCA
jgi:hypothetical protein